MIRPLFLLLISIQLFAIVAIKPREVGEKPGLSGELSGAFETKRGNTEKDNYSGSLQLQFDSNTSYVIWGVVRGEYGEASGVRDTNNLFAHLRYIRNIVGADIAAEGFGQMEKDEFKSIEERALAGGGLRWKVLNKKRGEWGGLFIGAGAYAEYIGYSTSMDPLERNLRFNSYLAYSLPLSDKGVFTAVGYYQPKCDDFNDYYVTASARIELQIYRQLYLGFSVEYAHDSEPAVGVKQDDFSQRTLFTFKF
ncbi:DUF481 domain-containing protein [Sulfurimonas sp. HSL1-6]|uniref:DUF481 domain-containing protein n=1 Tax=Thiomicrolovo immobilis TaxID=3131935 RepID=UPI0031F887AB